MLKDLKFSITRAQTRGNEIQVVDKIGDIKTLSRDVQAVPRDLQIIQKDRTDNRHDARDGIEIVGNKVCAIYIALETPTGSTARTVSINGRGECNNSTEIGIEGKLLENGYLLKGVFFKINGKNVVCTNCRYINKVYKDELRRNSVVYCQICDKKGSYRSKSDAPNEFQQIFMSSDIDGILV